MSFFFLEIDYHYLWSYFFLHFEEDMACIIVGYMNVCSVSIIPQL